MTYQSNVEVGTVAVQIVNDEPQEQLVEEPTTDEQRDD